MAAADVASYDGWYAWRVDAPDGKVLNDIRADLLQFSVNPELAIDADGSDTLDDDPHVSGDAPPDVGQAIGAAS